jgi:hypothetical protein
MTDYRPPNAIAALEQARAKLEIVLRANAQWRALGQATLPANRVALERALADNPLYDAWKLLGQALGELQAGRALGTEKSREGAVPATAPPPQARRARVELRDVLERIRVEAPVDRAEPRAAATDGAPGEPRAAPAVAPADIEIEEATVSFVVRAPARPGPQSAPAPEQAVEPAGSQEGTREGAGASGASAACGDDGDGAETEVTIVPRRS